MAIKTDEEKILFNPYISISTIKRYLSLDSVSARDVFIKAQEFDERNGYIKIYDDRVRSEAVFKVLGLDLETALKRYRLKKDLEYTVYGQK